MNAVLRIKRKDYALRHHRGMPVPWQRQPNMNGCHYTNDTYNMFL